jgi:hypothetical protein
MEEAVRVGTKNILDRHTQTSVGKPSPLIGNFPNVTLGVSEWEPALRRVPLSDVVGIVVATGVDYLEWKIGDPLWPDLLPELVGGQRCR